MDDALTLFTAAREAGVAWYGMAAASVTVAIRLLRIEQVQSLLPLRWRWEQLPRVARWALIAVAAYAAAWVAALMSGQGPMAAAVAAFPVAVAAVAAHKGTQAVGHGMTRRASAKEPEYEPGAIRTKLAVVLPIDRAAVAAVKARVKADSHADGNGSL